MTAQRFQFKGSLRTNKYLRFSPQRKDIWVCLLLKTQLRHGVRKRGCLNYYYDNFWSVRRWRSPYWACRRLANNLEVWDAASQFSKTLWRQGCELDSVRVYSRHLLLENRLGALPLIADEDVFDWVSIIRYQTLVNVQKYTFIKSYILFNYSHWLLSYVKENLSPRDDGGAYLLLLHVGAKRLAIYRIVFFIYKNEDIYSSFYMRWKRERLTSVYYARLLVFMAQNVTGVASRHYLAPSRTDRLNLSQYKTFQRSYYFVSVKARFLTKQIAHKLKSYKKRLKVGHLIAMMHRVRSYYNRHFYLYNLQLSLLWVFIRRRQIIYFRCVNLYKSSIKSIISKSLEISLQLLRVEANRTSSVNEPVAVWGSVFTRILQRVSGKQKLLMSLSHSLFLSFHQHLYYSTKCNWSYNKFLYLLIASRSMRLMRKLSIERQIAFSWRFREFQLNFGREVLFSVGFNGVFRFYTTGRDKFLLRLAIHIWLYEVIKIKLKVSESRLARGLRAISMGQKANAIYDMIFYKVYNKSRGLPVVFFEQKVSDYLSYRRQCSSNLNGFTEQFEAVYFVWQRRLGALKDNDFNAFRRSDNVLQGSALVLARDSTKQRKFVFLLRNMFCQVVSFSVAHFSSLFSAWRGCILLYQTLHFQLLYMKSLVPRFVDVKLSAQHIDVIYFITGLSRIPLTALLGLLQKHKRRSTVIKRVLMVIWELVVIRKNLQAGLVFLQYMLKKSAYPYILRYGLTSLYERVIEQNYQKFLSHHDITHSYFFVQEAGKTRKWRALLAYQNWLKRVFFTKKGLKPLLIRVQFYKLLVIKEQYLFFRDKSYSTSLERNKNEPRWVDREEAIATIFTQVSVSCKEQYLFFREHHSKILYANWRPFIYGCLRAGKLLRLSQFYFLGHRHRVVYSLGAICALNALASQHIFLYVPSHLFSTSVMSWLTYMRQARYREGRQVQKLFVIQNHGLDLGPKRRRGRPRADKGDLKFGWRKLALFSSYIYSYLKTVRWVQLNPGLSRKFIILNFYFITAYWRKLKNVRIALLYWHERYELH